MALPNRLPKKAKRDTRWRSQAHLGFVRSFHCAVPGCQGMPIEAAHVRLGSGAGMGQKPDDFRAAPLCKFHHSSQHSQGEETFWSAYKAASGQSVDQLLDELCKASPKAAEIKRVKAERLVNV
ncbi:DUF1364 domain-containing protein [Novosphingobium sp. JCM 18896]|uniref:DUF1364 domain-containing protein n=1 Tax=Novosphingobium sp. JCM 18896 TaxID=2989731 RepID=UPI0022218BDC|nr:DUF1364 domain-containing protein [Novosphingobium sp. JCM 18896]MCW1431364.1 DUF1364 domain-containing protein [Novosphingobium sp. JCM 18896]